MTPGYWQAVARSSDLRRKPLRVLVNDRAIVLFRTSDGVSALHDRCPHRHVELSKGRVVGDTIECPYHGWRFAGDGNCVEMPGCIAAIPKARAARYVTTEKDGAIFLAQEPISDAPYTHVMQGQDIVTRMVKSETRSTLVDAAENILDATHTHFTHKGLLRGLSDKRYRVQVEVTAGDDWVQASYTGEDRQHGFISKILDGSRVKTMGRYRRSGIAELEYWGPRGLVIATTFHLRQATRDSVEGIGWLTGPRERGLGHLKALAFKPLFKIALEQDRRVLRSAYDNAGIAKRFIGPMDFLREDIEAIEAGQVPNQTPRYFEMSL